MIKTTMPWNILLFFLPILSVVHPSVSFVIKYTQSSKSFKNNNIDVSTTTNNNDKNNILTSSNANQHVKQQEHKKKRRSRVVLKSVYDNIYLDENYDEFDEADPSYEDESLSCTRNTKLLLGMNKYTHDTSICAANMETGEILFNLELERLSRKKHASGSISSLIETCLDQLDIPLQNVKQIVVNNHHHRVLPLEDAVGRDGMEWYESLGINDVIADSAEENLLSQCNNKIEVSHHLAHAYSVVCQCTEEKGMVVVMDGMGETYRTMKSSRKDSRYFSDFDLVDRDGTGFENIPSDIEQRVQDGIFDWREGESVYIFEKDMKNKCIRVKPVFKRWIEEQTPPTLYNHGFENMNSLGGIYSRVSSHIFGDWNACGKVMGMAPWGLHTWTSSSATNEMRKNQIPIMTGKLYSEEENDKFRVDKRSISGKSIHSHDLSTSSYNFDESHEPNATDTHEAIQLSYSIQDDLENVVLDFISHFQKSELVQGYEDTLCLAGGVALNSVVNGRILRELNFRNVFIPPYPGDEGIGVGCCAFGLFGYDWALHQKSLHMNKEPQSPPVWTNLKLWTKPLSPYLGPLYSTSEIQAVLSQYEPWLEIQAIPDEKTLHDIITRELESGGIVALYQGRSESGARALGHRSILADPRKLPLTEFINSKVKKRELFRPFAPSVLADHVSEWFDVPSDVMTCYEDGNISPFMSITLSVKDDKRSLIPAVTHIDGTSRLQSVTKQDEPFYYSLIQNFFKLTGVPMILNTSFNTLKGEPIVESPQEAIRSFMSTMGAIEFLVIDNFIVKRKQPNIRTLLGEKLKNGLISIPKNPKRPGDIMFKTEYTVQEYYTTTADNEDNEDDAIKPITKVRMPKRLIHNENDDQGWFTLLDDLEGEILALSDGSVSVQEMIQQFHYPNSDDKEATMEDFDEGLFENVIRRLVRLYEHTFISW